MNRKGIAVSEMPKMLIALIVMAGVIIAVGLMLGFGPEGIGNKFDIFFQNFNEDVEEKDSIVFRYDIFSGEVKYLDADWKDFPKDNGAVRLERFEFTEDQIKKDFIAYYSGEREDVEIVLSEGARFVLLDSASAALFEDELKVIFHTFRRSASNQAQLKSSQNPLVIGFYGAAFPGQKGIYSTKRWEMVVDYNGEIFVDKNPIGWPGEHVYEIIEKRTIAEEFDKLPQEDYDLIVKTAEEFRNSVLDDKISLTGAGDYDVDLIDNFLVVRVNE